MVDEPIDAAIGFNVIDTTIHTWDVARALGVDDRLDPGLVERVSVLLAARVEEMRGGRGYAPAVDVAEGADPQTALLALAGRRAT